MSHVSVRPGRGSRRWGLARGGAAIAVVLAAVGFGGLPANGHVTLSASSPAPGSTASGSPKLVQLRFVVPAVADPRTYVAVVAPSGRDLADGATAVTDLGVGQMLSSSDETGQYDVHYRVVLWGGHVDEGRFRFFVEPADESNHLGPWAWFGGGALVLALLYVLHAFAGRRAESKPHPAPDRSSSP